MRGDINFKQTAKSANKRQRERQNKEREEESLLSWILYFNSISDFREKIAEIFSCVNK